jgi:5-methylcytosine-specific restriction endonuclease McrA
VDELVPVSKGGDPLDRANCRLTHRHCNRQRGAANDEYPKPARPGVTFITDRRW